MKRFLLTAGLALPHLLFAQAPSGVSLDRDRPLVGETVTVVVNFEAATRWCGLRVDLGDGDVRDLRVEDFPLTLTKQYASTGRYVIRATGRALPRGLLSVLPCTGRARTAALEVVEARRDEPLSPRQENLQGDSVDLKELRKKEDERQKQAEKHERERQKQERKREDRDKREREREKRDQAEERERARRASEAVRQPPAHQAAPAAPPPPAPRRAAPPAPAASKPLDGSLKVF